MDNLDIQEVELRAKLDEIVREKARLAEAERLAAATRPVTITVSAFVGAMVIVSAAYRDDLLALWKSIPGRAYRGSSENAIPIGVWSQTESRLLDLPNISIAYADGVGDTINKHLNAPVWDIDIQVKQLKLVAGPQADASILRDIPGKMWDARLGYYTMPLSEAWRLYQTLADIPGVIYSDAARDFILHQVKARGKLDEIGLATEMEYDAGFIDGYKLRPFQGVGCNFLEATGGKALLAYQMGLGKTPMSLAYAWKNKFKTVIICTASLKSNWCRQITKFTGVTPLVLSGSTPKQSDYITLLTGDHKFVVINYDIIGASIEYDDESVDEQGRKHTEHKQRFLWTEALNFTKFDLIIFDESHYIKNTSSNRSQASRKLIAPHIIHMTGTPVMNRPGELWPILTMLAPSVFPYEETFIRQYTLDGKRAINVEHLQAALKTIMIRRKHADVKKELPPLDRITEYHELSAKARKIYEKILQGVYERISEYDVHGRGGSMSNVTNILVQIQRLKQVCAIDKVDATAELATELYDSSGGENHSKILIFSQFKAVAYAISRRLGQEALCFVSRGEHDFVTANDKTRDDLVQQFQSDPSIHYLVVTEKTAKEGHDITAAGTVIFNDLFWTPANHEQGEGRAYMRESDPHGITSYYMIVDGNSGAKIEEWIWDLLKMKNNIIAQTVDSVEASRDVNIAMDLIAKIKESMWTR